MTANALQYYSSLSRLLMRSEIETGFSNCNSTPEDLDNYFSILAEILTPLRFYLACRVCNHLLVNSMTPDHTACQHTVCSQCMGKKMKLKPSCGWCQSYSNFKPNPQLDLLVKCYTKLCDYTLSSKDFNYKASKVKQNGSPTASLIKCLDTMGEARDYGLMFSERLAEDLPQQRGESKEYTNFPSNMSENNCFETRETSSQLSEIQPSEGLSSSMKKSGRSRNASEPTSGTPQRIVPGMKRLSATTRSQDRKGCGCGVTASAPSKLTCYGQRCPCYSNQGPCIDCRCRGCRNPNKVVRIEQSEATDNEVNVE